MKKEEKIASPEQIRETGDIIGIDLEEANEYEIS